MSHGSISQTWQTSHQILISRQSTVKTSCPRSDLHSMYFGLGYTYQYLNSDIQLLPAMSQKLNSMFTSVFETCHAISRNIQQKEKRPSSRPSLSETHTNQGEASYFGSFHVGAEASQLQPYLTVVPVWQIVRSDSKCHPEYPLHRAVQGSQRSPQHPGASKLILHLWISAPSFTSTAPFTGHRVVSNRWLGVKHTGKKNKTSAG